MTIDEAIQSAKSGNFVTNSYFDSYESMHYYNGCLYYEDGAVLNERTIHNLHIEDWSKKGWSIKYSKDKIDHNALIKLHQEANGAMLSQRGKSYEDCVIK